MSVAYHAVGKLQNENSDDIPEDDNVYNRRRWYWEPLKTRLLTVGIVVFSIWSALLVSQIIQFRVTDEICGRRLSFWSPGLDVIEYQKQTFKAGFGHQNDFKGSPSPELDAAWSNLTKEYKFPINKEQLGRIEKSADVLSVDGGYIVGVEVFHQLHCLDMVRKYTYKDYYLAAGEYGFQAKPEHLRIHIDHCIDVLRQTLMCNGDVGVMTFNWVKGHHKPAPDFNTHHVCRNFDRIQSWASSMDRHYLNRDFVKPDDAVELDDFPDP